MQGRGLPWRSQQARLPGTDTQASHANTSPLLVKQDSFSDPGVDLTRGDDVGPDALPGIHIADVPGQADHAVLRGRVRSSGATSEETPDRGDGDKGALAIPEHLRYRSPGRAASAR